MVQLLKDPTELQMLVQQYECSTLQPLPRHVLLAQSQIKQYYLRSLSYCGLSYSARELKLTFPGGAGSALRWGVQGCWCAQLTGRPHRQSCISVG